MRLNNVHINVEFVECVATASIISSYQVSQFYSTGLLFSLYMFDVTLPLLNIPILLDDVMCAGNKTALLQCSHNGFNNHNCHHSEDIVLACVGKRNTQLK